MVYVSTGSTYLRCVHPPVRKCSQADIIPVEAFTQHNTPHSPMQVPQQWWEKFNENKLFDMVNDPGQHKDISQQNPEITEKLITAKEEWEKEVLSELPEEDSRPFPVGHPDYEFTQIPARDGIPFGNIQRSNRYPNCSFFSNWINTDDKITWDVEVLADGDFEVTLYF